jgi:hypothetical protein
MSAGFTALGFAVTAVDASPSARAYAMDEGATFVAHSVNSKASIPVPDDSFDAIFAHDHAAGARTWWVRLPRKLQIPTTSYYLAQSRGQHAFAGAKN